MRAAILDRLSRPASGGAFIPEMDGLRFVAITLVVLHHNHFVLRNTLPDMSEGAALWGLYRHLVAAGGFGVPLFFVISGLVLGLPFARYHLAGGPKISLRAYVWRRIRRLEPPYVINLTLLFALMIASGGMQALGERLPAYLASVFYLHNTIYNAWSQINFVAWSLEVEAQFYILAPLLGLCFMWRNRMVAYIALIAAGCIVNLTTMDGAFRITHSILALGQYFVVGLLLADLMVTRRLYPTTPRIAFDTLALVFLVAALATDLGYPAPWAKALGVVPLLLFFLCLFTGRVILAALRWRPIYTVGGMCYTIYLYHFWIIQAPVRALKLDQTPLNIWQALAFDAGMTALVICVSAVLFALFERPFMNQTVHKPKP